MKTTMRALRFGIEIETVGLTCEQLARAIHAVVGGTLEPNHYRTIWYVTDPSGRRWKAEPDASLSGGTRSGEIVSPVLGYQDLDVLQRIVRAVQSAGARADWSTGIHIHVDGSRFDVKNIVNLVRFVHKQERLFEHAFAAHPSRVDYCKPIDRAFLDHLERRPPKTMEDLSAAWYGERGVTPQRRHQSRRHGLNLNSFFYRTTIEFRYFNGTLDADAVKANVQLVLALATYALNAKSASSKRRAFSPDTAKYDFRVVLLRLGLIGEEFRTTRRILTGRLAGSAAWKHGRRDRPAPDSNAPTSGHSSVPDRRHVATSQPIMTAGSLAEEMAR